MPSDNSDNDDSNYNYVYQASGVTTTKLPIFNVHIAGCLVTATADTGSTCNIIDEKTYEKINENYVKTKGMKIRLSNTAQEILTFNSDHYLENLKHMLHQNIKRL